jgi:hypothetical protein
MTEQNELTYKEMSAVADKNGFYLIPMAYYNRMFEEIYNLRKKLDEVTKSRDDWKEKLRKEKMK